MQKTILLSFLPALISTTLIVDFKAGDSLLALGCPSVQCSADIPTNCDFSATTQSSGSSKIAIEQDPSGKTSVHFHREPTCRRAEVQAKGSYGPNKNYYMGYQFKLSNVHQHLAIFQWKKDDESAEPSQNIPFNLQFNNTKDTRLSLGYTSPNLDYKTLWTADSDFDTSAVHNIALAWDTMGSANSKIQMWFDGQMVVEQGGLTLWTGKTYPKLGIYRGEQGDHDTAGYTNDFDLWVYRVMIGDGGLDEVAEAGGIQAQSKRGMNNGYQMSKKSVLNNNHEPRGAEDSVAYSAPSRLSRRQNENRASPVGSSGTGLKYRSGPSLNTKREDHLEQGSENDQEVGADDLVTWFAKRHRAVDEESANIRARHEGGQEPEHPKGSGDGNRHKNDGDSPSTESWFVKRNVGGRGFR